MLTAPSSQLAVCLTLTQAISRARTVAEICTIALDALDDGLGVRRASILLFDEDDVMRFTAWRHLSDTYRAAVEGHTPWTPQDADAQPIGVGDVTREPSLAAFLDTIQAEGIAAMGFIPLVSLDRVIGKFMLYYDVPHEMSEGERQMAAVIASQVAFAVARIRAEDQATRSEARLRFALDAVSMGTWEWNIGAETVQWSANLERLHGLPGGTFDGTFDSYAREIHPDDREAVLASLRRAVTDGVPHDVEYRIVGPDGDVQWVEGKGQVEYEDGLPIRMTGVCVVVTRRKEAELAKLAAAEDANRLKDEFLATLSHELRTPLHAVIGWVQLLQSGHLPPDRVHQAVDVIGRNAALQAQLIEDILDVSRIVAGKIELDRRPVIVPRVMDDVVAGLLPAAEAKRIAVATAMSPALPLVLGDAKRLHQVLGNVLSNAIKFTPEDGRVEIRCAPEDEGVRIEVRDSGPGIAPEFLPYAFDRFRQGDSGSTRRHGGLGLGLSIARQLLDAHGGSIQAHSDGVGTGTTVVIRLPAVASAAAGSASAPLAG
jgi:nitrogen-specific signal transduction histidine kinase/GAF domain-containing protein